MRDATECCDENGRSLGAIRKSNTHHGDNVRRMAFTRSFKQHMPVYDYPTGFLIQPLGTSSKASWLHSGWKKGWRGVRCTSGSPSSSSSADDHHSAGNHAKGERFRIRKQITIWIEATAAWLADQSDGGDSVSPVQRLRRMGETTAAPSKNTTDAGKKLGAYTDFRYHVVLFQSGAEGWAHSVEYVTRSILSHMPWVPFGVAHRIAKRWARLGRAELATSDIETAEQCSVHFLADGIMSSVETKCAMPR